MTYSEKLSSLRNEMKKKGIHAYVIASSDPHINEYLPEHYKSISWISGFTGSAGTLVITQDLAGLWTDSRYFVQANEQLSGTGFKLMKLQNQGVPEYADWLSKTLSAEQIVAFDGKTTSITAGKTIINTLEPKKIIVSGDIDLLTKIWKDRPSLPTNKAFLLSETITGRSTAEKLQQVRTALKNQGANHHLLSSLDDIAWLFNIRGSDVKCNPVVLSFALIDETEATLYIDIHKITEEDQTALLDAGVSLRPYSEIENAIREISKNSSVFIDPKRNCFTFYQLIPSHCNKILETNPSTSLKAIKNDIELSNTRKTMIKDGVALTRFFYWLDMHLGKQPISELTIAEKLFEFRSEQKGFVGESFDTIAGYKKHGALPHYKATPKSNIELTHDGLLLIDSGGQYITGTTDITRVISLGNITKEQQQDYTLVLKGTIEGSTTYFPEGTKGYQIDAITRKPLWDYHRNYGHGTGHGVGFFLNVHEGPHVFNAANINIPIQPLMITSIEPGLYREGHYGIRIENLVVSHLDKQSEFGQFLSFETLTLCYIDTSLINKTILEERHISWINNYNKEVYQKLSPSLTSQEKEWLKKKTNSI